MVFQLVGNSWDSTCTLTQNVLFYISCRSQERSSVCFLQRPWGVLLSSPFVITLCSYLRYQRRLRPTLSSFFSPLSPLYIPQIFLVRSPCFPFCVISSPWVLSFVPLWETLLPGLSAFESALKLSLTIGDLSYTQNKVIHLYGFRFFSAWLVLLLT